MFLVFNRLKDDMVVVFTRSFSKNGSKDWTHRIYLNDWSGHLTHRISSVPVLCPFILGQRWISNLYFVQVRGCFTIIVLSFSCCWIWINQIFDAAAICSMLKNWSGMDREKAKDYRISFQVFNLLYILLAIFFCSSLM